MAGTSQHISIRIARRRDELARHVPAWKALAAQALEANIFYESAMVLPALDHMGAASAFCFVMVYRGSEMIGFFPFWPARRGPRGIIRVYRSFVHINCYLTTPLVHRAAAVEAMDAVLDWLDTAPQRTRVLGFYMIGGNDAFSALLGQRLKARGQPYMVEGSHQRAILQPAATARDYLDRTLSTKKAKEYRRQRRRLEELGAVSFTTITGGAEAGQWAEQFVNLEMGGWKRHGNAAFGIIAGGRLYLRDVITRLAHDGRVALHTLALDGEPIAMKCNFMAAGGPPSQGFSYKITYDEAYARYSPGVLLELHNIEHVHASQGAMSWMDSCADPGHPMIEHLWEERRDILYITCVSRSLAGRFTAAAMKWRGKRARR